MKKTHFHDLEEVKNRMAELNISTRGLATRVGISSTAMQKIINGKTDFDRIQLQTYKDIVKTLWK